MEKVHAHFGQIIMVIRVIFPPIETSIVHINMSLRNEDHRCRKTRTYSYAIKFVQFYMIK